MIFGLFRVVPGFSGINGRDGDGGDEGLVAVEVGVAFGQDVDGGEVIFAELVGQEGEPPAEQHHVSGEESQGEFLRWCVLVLRSVRVWLQRVINQLAGMKTTALREAGLRLFRQVELDAGAILAGSGVTGIISEGHGR